MDEIPNSYCWCGIEERLKDSNTKGLLCLLLLSLSDVSFEELSNQISAKEQLSN
ncbi:MAG: hypothetical protein IKL27_07120 [Oscillospiraceae bacterium]|nr:hypothetical protein [Oscillospiraceae bacterium]